MGKKSGSERRAKLKKRRRLKTALEARDVAPTTRLQQWVDANGVVPNIVVALADGHGEVLAHLMCDADDSWTDVVDDQPVAGAGDHSDALALLLDGAIDRKATAGTCSMQLSPRLAEEVERRCESSDIAAEDFLRSLLPRTKQLAAPPQLSVLDTANPGASFARATVAETLGAARRRKPPQHAGNAVADLLTASPVRLSLEDIAARLTARGPWK